MSGTPDDVEGHLAPAPAVPRALGATDRKTATVLSVVTVAAAGGRRTATAQVRTVTPGPHEISGWVLVTSGPTVLAQVQVRDGGSVASWTVPPHGGPSSVVLSYTGDDRHAPCSRSLEL
jgi:hypothetical protein